MKLHTILSPLKNSGLVEISGRRIILDVAGKKIDFLVHEDQNLFPVLSHYASGQRVCQLRPSLDHSYRRKFAQGQIDRLIESLGAETVLSRLDGAEIIN